MAPPRGLRGLPLDEACLRQLVANGALGSALWSPDVQDVLERSLRKAFGRTAASGTMRRVSEQLTVRCLRRIATAFEAYTQGSGAGNKLAVSQVMRTAKDLDRVRILADPSAEETRTVLQALVIAALHLVKITESIKVGYCKGNTLIHTFV